MSNSSNLLAQLLTFVDKRLFQSIVNRHNGDKGAKGFTCWSQFVTMLFAHIAGFDSLRETVDGLATQGGKLNHFGLEKAPSRSNLAYANEHRPAEIFEEFFYALVALLQPKMSGGIKPKNFNGNLFSFDSTTINLCLSLFPWAKFHHMKGAFKIHLMLSHEGMIPVFANVTEGSVHDVKALKDNLDEVLPILVKHSWIVMDRGYNDYELFQTLTENEVNFVTRLKTNAAYDVVEELPLDETDRTENVLRDRIITFTGPSGRKCDKVRIVEFHDVEKDRNFVFVTNNGDFSATTIAQMYKCRWQVELFFKSLKQNMKIKSFMGTSLNSVKIQVYCTLCAILLLKYAKSISDSKRKEKGLHTFSFSNFVCLVRLNLTHYVSLNDWLLNPFPPSPQENEAEFGQLNLWDGIPTKGGLKRKTGKKCRFQAKNETFTRI